MTPPAFNFRLDEAIEQTGSLLCVGLDPHPDRVREPLGDFCRRMIDATQSVAVAFKPNSAFFEVAGAAGIEALATVIAHCPTARS